MRKREKLTLFAILLVFIYVIVKTPYTHAQQSNSDGGIPSDLSLDLKFAEQNPSPAQKQIIQLQTPRAQITTSSGDQVSIIVKDIVPPEVKVQSAQDVTNPDQTTSEQVITKNAEEPNGENNQGSNGQQNNDNVNNIPGTSIVEPDDNSAPSINPNTHENQPPVTSPTTPTDTSTNYSQPAGNSNNTETPTTDSQNSSTPPPTNSTTQQTSDTIIPPENGPSQNNNQAPESNPSSDNTSSDTSPDSSAVQGVSTGPVIYHLQQFINIVFKIFTK